MMKHYKYISLIMCSILALTSCGNVQPQTTSVLETTTTTTVPECEESSMDESSEDEKPDDNNWRIDYFADQFGDYDYNNPYIRSKYIEGEFSNSATSGSLLYVQPIITDYFAFKLYEYGELPVTNSFKDKEYYSILFKFETGERSNWHSGYFDSYSGDRLILHGEKTNDELREHLLNGETVKIFLEEIDRPVCQYLFTLNGEGFKEVYQEYEETRKE